MTRLLKLGVLYLHTNFKIVVKKVQNSITGTIKREKKSQILPGIYLKPVKSMITLSYLHEVEKPKDKEAKLMSYSYWSCI